MFSLRPRFAGIRLLLGFIVATGGCAAGPDQPAAEGTDDPVADASTWFPLTIDEVALEAQIAIEPAEMSRGLMHRDHLGEDRGMLFVYDAPQRMSFWMRNTRIDLAIGFFDPDGRLLETRTLYAYDETAVRSRSANVQFALEMNRGWFREKGIRTGARLDMKRLGEALEARGSALP